MNRIMFLLLGSFGLIVAVVGIYLVLLPLLRDPQYVDGTYVGAYIKGKRFDLEVASSLQKRSQGLMNRDLLAKNEGMLFVFQKPGFHTFWMRNTLIPLDIIWLNADKKIVYIKENAQPCENVIAALCKLIVPKSFAKYVIEINGGMAREIGLKIGDYISF